MKTALTLGISLQGRILRYLNIKHKKVGGGTSAFCDFILALSESEKWKRLICEFICSLEHPSLCEVQHQTSCTTVSQVTSPATAALLSVGSGFHLCWLLNNAGSTVTAGAVDCLSKTKAVIPHRTALALCAAVAIKSMCFHRLQIATPYAPHHLTAKSRQHTWNTMTLHCMCLYLFCQDRNGNASPTIWSIYDWVIDRSCFHNWPAKSAEFCHSICIWHKQGIKVRCLQLSMLPT